MTDVQWFSVSERILNVEFLPKSRKETKLLFWFFHRKGATFLLFIN